MYHKNKGIAIITVLSEIISKTNSKLTVVILRLGGIMVEMIL